MIQIKFRRLAVLIIALNMHSVPGLSDEPGSIDGSAIYHDYCSVCHGDKGDGDSHARQGLKPPPADFTQPATAARLTRAYMVAIVRDGKPGTAMTAWSSRLNDSEIAVIVDYIRSRFMHIPDTPEIPAENPRGYEIYHSMCSVCHGDDGEGARWAGAGLKPAPRNFTTMESRTSLTREQMHSAILAGRPGTAMTPFATQLSNEDINAVIDYIQQTFMQ